MTHSNQQSNSAKPSKLVLRVLGVIDQQGSRRFDTACRIADFIEKDYLPRKQVEAAIGEQEFYKLLQDIVYEYGRGQESSKHYAKTKYGGSFNTEAFCREWAHRLHSKIVLNTKKENA